MYVNIISNNCAGAAIYKYVLQSSYQNPFIWCTTNVDQLMLHFHNIQFDKFSLFNESKQLDKVWHIQIDNLIDCRFLHAKFDPAQQTPYIHDVDVYYNKIWEYLVNNYVKRVQRMLRINTEPIYVLYIHAKHQLKFIDIADSTLVPYIVIAPKRLYSHPNVCVHEDSNLTINSVVRVINRYKLEISRALQLKYNTLSPN